MGLQYFEALSPGTIASIVSVLTNRILSGNDVTGYYSYPFLTTALPSSIFSSAVIYGLYGCVVGIGYSHGSKLLKVWVHDWFHEPHDDHGHDDEDDDDQHHHDGKEIEVGNGSAEYSPLVSQKFKKTGKKRQAKASCVGCLKAYFCPVIPDEGMRAAVAGVLAGAICGVVGIFVPHTMFWGEAQLQNLIDKGRTPLPIFGESEDPTGGLTAHAFCMIDPTDGAAIRAGFSLGCAALIAISKVFVIGLSLGTGIIGGRE
jgi:H+/Cl- antiporter ClcA